MVDAIHIEAVETILSGIYASGDARISSFIVQKPGAPLGFSGIGTEIFTRGNEYLKAVFFIRRNGAAYLRSMSISELRSLVTKFVTSNFWHVLAGEFSRRHDCSYAAQVDPKGKLLLAEALAASPLFNPINQLTLFPLVPVRIEEDFESSRFFMLSADHLSLKQLPEGLRAGEIDPVNFPPMVRWDGQKRKTTSWLGVRFPLLQVSKKAASAILGAVALTPLPEVRYLFSGRTTFGGICTVTRKEFSVAGGGDAHTPPLMDDIVITKQDHGWLNRLAALLDADDLKARRQLKALEYFYRAWFLNSSERFPWLCMSLDSLVGVRNGHTAAAKKFISDVISHPIEADRLTVLMHLRGAVIHGVAPDVFESDNYEAYYMRYDTDPIRDLEMIVAKCLREDIFGDSLPYHAHPHADKIAEMEAKGRLNKDRSDKYIIPPSL